MFFEEPLEYFGSHSPKRIPLVTSTIFYSIFSLHVSLTHSLFLFHSRSFSLSFIHSIEFCTFNILIISIMFIQLLISLMCSFANMSSCGPEMWKFAGLSHFFFAIFNLFVVFLACKIRKRRRNYRNWFGWQCEWCFNYKFKNRCC